MKDIIVFKTSGSGDFDSSYLRKIVKNNNKKVKVRFAVSDRRAFKGEYIISSYETDKEKLNEIYNHVRGIASHCEWITT